MHDFRPREITNMTGTIPIAERIICTTKELELWKKQAVLEELKRWKLATGSDMFNARIKVLQGEV